MGVRRKEEPDLQVIETKEKGRGVHSARMFRKDEFVVEYR
jgi:hypothetical protein